MKRGRSLLLIAIVPCLLSTAAAAAGDADMLRALHQKVMQAHLQGNVDMLLEDEAADYVVAGRGDVSRPTLDERRARLGPYLQRTRFAKYVDMVPPIVTVSRDGSLGWVVVQVEAKGVQQAAGGKPEPVEFVCAWIELYEKRDGRWYRTGNVSTFRP